MMEVPFKQTLKRVHMDLPIKQVIKLLAFGRAKFGLIDHVLSSTYMKHNEIRKLQIGCGCHVLDKGWLNSDFYPLSAKILHLDATRDFPFPDQQFDFIFSEHMIEHVNYSDGLSMLNECFRVLKQDGVIRISTPDLSFLIRLFHPTRSEIENKYIDWATKCWISDAPYCDAVFVINNFVRAWGHLFIYDEKTLRSALQKVGFTRITRRQLSESEHDPLKNLENVGRLPDGLLQLETLTLEGTKV